MAAASGSAGAGAQIPGSQALCGLPQARHGSGDRPRQQIAHQSRSNDGDGDAEQWDVVRPEKYSGPRRQNEYQGVAFAIQCERLPDDAIGQQRVEPAMVARRSAAQRTVEWRPARSNVFHTRPPPGNLMTRRIENRGPYVLRAPEFFNVFVGGVLSAGLVCVHGLRQNLRALTLNSMARWAERDRRKDSEHDEQHLGCPER